MSRPPLVPGAVRRSGTKAWAVWDCLWVLLDDGRWHRGLDLANAVHAAGHAHALSSGFSGASRILRYAAGAGLLERDVRRVGRANQSGPFAGLAPYRSRQDPWYRVAGVR